MLALALPRNLGVSPSYVVNMQVSTHTDEMMMVVDRTVGITWIMWPFAERFHHRVGVLRNGDMWTFWLDPDTQRMCIKRREEWEGVLRGSSYEELFGITAADF